MCICVHTYARGTLAGLPDCFDFKKNENKFYGDLMNDFREISHKYAISLPKTACIENNFGSSRFLEGEKTTKKERENQ